jgi:actin-related protein 5
VNELFFECYNVPGVSYGLDSAFSFHQNMPLAQQRSPSLIISSGYQNTHVIPVIDFKFVLNQARRINLGGINHTGFFQRLMQLKNPGLAKQVTYWNSEVLFDLSFFSFFPKRNELKEDSIIMTRNCPTNTVTIHWTTLRS